MLKTDPLNIKILKVNKTPLTEFKLVTSLRIFEQGTQNFDKKGLFSTEIFGRVGSEERLRKLGLIDLKIDLLHPLAYRTLGEINKFYLAIIDGNAYAKFNSKTKDFEYASPDDGEKGFDFFMRHFEELEYRTTKSSSRDAKIELLRKYKKDGFIINMFTVYPAGLRDYTVTDGKPSEDEINDLYRSLLRKVSMLENYNIKTLKESSEVDHIRASMQKTILQIYAYLESLIDGKSKFVTGKWAKRSVVDGTMNVITPSTLPIQDLNSKHIVSFNDTVVGLFQYLKMIMPFLVFAIKNRFLNNVFEQFSNNAKLINMDSFKQEYVSISNNTRNRWLTRDGINSIVNKLFAKEYMELPVVIENRYLALIYKDKDVVSVVYNINELTKEIDIKKLKPITYAELFYLSIADEAIAKKFPALTSRYPTSGQGGIYPTKLFVRTTSKAETVKLVENLLMPENYKTIYEYPIIGETYINTFSFHSTRIGALAADFDGDKGTLTALLTDDSIAEVNKILGEPYFYLNNRSKLMYSSFDPNLDFIIKTLSRRRK